MAPALVLAAPATATAFYVVFGLFVVAMVVLVVIIIVWAVRNDIAGRRAWRARQEAAMGVREQGDLFPPPQQQPQQQSQPQPRPRQRPPRSKS
jgi:hypothetical protein